MSQLRGDPICVKPHSLQGLTLLLVRGARELDRIDGAWSG